MKKIIFVFILLIASYPLMAQDDEKKNEIPEGWSGEGAFSLMFSQAAFNNDWQAGGTSNYAGDLSINYGLTFKQDRLIWVNNFIGEYGTTKQKGDSFMRKTNDKIDLNSVLGYKVSEESKWSYSFMVDFKSQFAKGFKYDNANQTRTENTRFLSPGYLKFGPGMLYQDGDRLFINIAPATSRLVFVDKHFTTIPGYVDESYYGMDFGKTSRYELGASIDARLKTVLMENVVLGQNLSLFSNYLDNPGNVDIDYTLRVDMKVNKFLSANFIFQAIYEDKAVSAFQIREGIGVGFSYIL